MIGTHQSPSRPSRASMKRGPFPHRRLCCPHGSSSTTTRSDSRSSASPFPGFAGYRRASLPATPQATGPRRVSPVPRTPIRPFNAQYAGGSLGARFRIPDAFHGLRRRVNRLGTLYPAHKDGSLDDACSGFTHVADRTVASAPLRTRPLDHARGHRYQGPGHLPGPDSHRQAVLNLSLDLRHDELLLLMAPEQSGRTTRERQPPADVDGHGSGAALTLVLALGPLEQRLEREHRVVDPGVQVAERGEPRRHGRDRAARAGRRRRSRPTRSASTPSPPARPAPSTRSRSCGRARSGCSRRTPCRARGPCATRSSSRRRERGARPRARTRAPRAAPRRSPIAARSARRRAGRCRPRSSASRPRRARRAPRGRRAATRRTVSKSALRHRVEVDPPLVGLARRRRAASSTDGTRPSTSAPPRSRWRARSRTARRRAGRSGKSTRDGLDPAGRPCGRRFWWTFSPSTPRGNRCSMHGRSRSARTIPSPTLM